MVPLFSSQKNFFSYEVIMTSKMSIFVIKKHTFEAKWNFNVLKMYSSVGSKEVFGPLFFLLEESVRCFP